MKKENSLILFLLTLMLIPFPVFAQKYKVKGDVIMKDEVALGKVIGKSNLVNSNFVIYGIDGEKVISIYRDEYKAPNPIFENMYWYNVRFEDTGKEMFLPMSVEFTVKAVLNKTFLTAGIIIDGGFVKNQEEIIANSDIKSSILYDTTYMGSFQRNTINLINSKPMVERKRDAPYGFIELSTENRNDTTFTKWEITQAGVRIGTYLERKRYLFSKDNYSYIIYRYLPDNGSEKDVTIAFGKADDLSTNMINLYTLIDKKVIQIKVTPTISTEMVGALIRGRYL